MYSLRSELFPSPKCIPYSQIYSLRPDLFPSSRFFPFAPIFPSPFAQIFITSRLLNLFRQY
jgi:hypothetical protein